MSQKLLTENQTKILKAITDHINDRIAKNKESKPITITEVLNSLMTESVLKTMAERIIKSRELLADSKEIDKE